MKKINGVTVVLYKVVESYYRFAVFRRILKWHGWELVKGEIKEGEDPKAAALRELAEEASIEEKDVEKIEKLDFVNSWIYKQRGEIINRQDVCFVVRVKDNTMIKVGTKEPREHDAGFFLNYRDAHDILSYENQKNLLRRVFARLNLTF